jgi:hypothetical protein
MWIDWFEPAIRMLSSGRNVIFFRPGYCLQVDKFSLFYLFRVPVAAFRHRNIITFSRNPKSGREMFIFSVFRNPDTVFRHRNVKFYCFPKSGWCLHIDKYSRNRIEIIYVFPQSVCCLQVYWNILFSAALVYEIGTAFILDDITVLEMLPLIRTTDNVTTFMTQGFFFFIILSEDGDYSDLIRIKGSKYLQRSR